MKKTIIILVSLILILVLKDDNYSSIIDLDFGSCCLRRVRK
jgi:hypothetical protein